MGQLNDIQREELFRISTEIVELRIILESDERLDLDSYVEILEKVNQLKALKNFIMK